MSLPEWNDLPVSARKSLRKYHKYLKSLENGEETPNNSNNDEG